METNNDNSNNDNEEKKIEETRMTDEERRAKLREMAQAAINKVESGEAKVVDGKEPDLLARPPRKIILSSMAEIIHKDEAGVEKTYQCYRAIFKLIDTLNDLPANGTYNIWLKEDEEKSDLPGKGEERIRRLYQPKPDMGKIELMKHLSSQYFYPHQAVQEFQKVCAIMGQHSQLKNVMITMVFDGARPSGFTYATDASEETPSDIMALGNASLQMANGYMSDMKKAHPNEVSFESDGDIILPGSVDTNKLMRSARTAQKLMKGSNG